MSSDPVQDGPRRDMCPDVGTIGLWPFLSRVTPPTEVPPQCEDFPLQTHGLGLLVVRSAQMSGRSLAFFGLPGLPVFHFHFLFVFVFVGIAIFFIIYQILWKRQVRSACFSSFRISGDRGLFFSPKRKRKRITSFMFGLGSKTLAAVASRLFETLGGLVVFM